MPNVMQKPIIAESQNEWTPKYLYIVASIFVTALLVSNLAAQKLFHLGPLVFSAGILVFPINYIFGDVLTEVYGFNRARGVIYCGLLANIFMALVLTIAIYLPPADGYTLQNAFEAVYKLVPRIVLASIMGYVAGELTNSAVLSKIKIIMSGKKLWVRTISSTFAGQLVDSTLFVLIAFAGVFSTGLLLTAILSSWLFKVLYEIIATPLTYYVVNKLKGLEGIDHYDLKDPYRLV